MSIEKRSLAAPENTVQIPPASEVYDLPADRKTRPLFATPEDDTPSGHTDEKNADSYDNTPAVIDDTNKTAMPYTRRPKTVVITDVGDVPGADLRRQAADAYRGF